MAPAATGTGGRGKPKRKRARKTRTAVVSDSSSSSSSSSDSSDEEADAKAGADKMLIDSDGDDESDSKSSSSSSTSSSSSSSDSSSSDDSDGSDVTDVRIGSKDGTVSTTSHPSQEDADQGRRRVEYVSPSNAKEDYSSDEEGEKGRSARVSLQAQNRSTMPSIPAMRSAFVETAIKRREEAIAEKEAVKAARRANERQTVAPSETREEHFHAMWMRMMIDEFGEELDALRKKEPTLSSDGGGRMPLLIDALQAGSELFSRGQPSEVADGLDQSDEVGLMLWGQQQDP